MNQFDDGGLQDNIRKVFMGPSGRACALIGGKPYFIRQESGNWEDALPDWKGLSLVASGKDPHMVLYTSVWQFFGTDAKSKKMESLILPPTLHGEQGGTPRSRWDPPDDWEDVGNSYFIPENEGLNGRAVFDGKDLFVLRKQKEQKNDPFSILWFRSDGGRKPLVVPLKLELSPADHEIFKDKLVWGKPALPEIISPTPASAFDYALTASDKGLLLIARSAGFWFIPFKDLRKWADDYNQRQARSASDIMRGA